jgi:hypothetical protein
MINRFTIEQMEKSHGEQIIASGKAQFVRREIGFSVLLFVMLTPFGSGATL